MLQNKDIIKIQEIKTLFKDSWIQPEFFSKQIELFNFTKASKLLGLGKSQSTNFDVQVAQTTITMIQYLMLSLKYRMEAMKQ